MSEASQDAGSETYQPLLHTQFNSVIEDLDRQTMRPCVCMPKGKDGGLPNASDSWSVVFSPGGRAFDKAVWPWFLVTLNAIFWTVITQVDGGIKPYEETSMTWNYDKAYNYGLTFTLSFLLTFRLNRSILRFWEGMKSWGNISNYCASLVSSVLVHGRDIPYHRDQVVAWTAAFPIALKRKLRYYEIIHADLGEILTREQITDLNEAPNSPLYAVHMIRKNLKPLFDVRPDYNHSPLSPARSSELRQHEKFLDALLHDGGKVENILNTPLPLVYISHLRTFLIIYLLSMPYMLGYLWNWATIFIVSATAAMMLGVEAAAAEVESPFEKGRVNDLDLDAYCASILRNIQQMVKRLNEKEKN